MGQALGAPKERKRPRTDSERAERAERAGRAERAEAQRSAFGSRRSGRVL